MSHFSIAKILPGAQRHDVETASEVWHGLAQLPSRSAPTPCYFKMLAPREFWIEYCCLAVSSAAELRVGECYLGDLMRTDLPDSRHWQANEARRMVIAVASIRGATIDALGEARAIRKLRKDPKFALMCVIDELFANEDRHSDNVMVDCKGNPYLIDFGHAFGGCDNPLNNPFPAFSNQLLDTAVAEMDARQRHAFQVDLGSAVNELKEALPVLNEVLANCPERLAMLDFVHIRMSILRELLAARLSAGLDQHSFRLTTQAEFRR